LSNHDKSPKPPLRRQTESGVLFIRGPTPTRLKPVPPRWMTRCHVKPRVFRGGGGLLWFMLRCGCAGDAVSAPMPGMERSKRASCASRASAATCASMAARRRAISAFRYASMRRQVSATCAQAPDCSRRWRGFMRSANSAMAAASANCNDRTRHKTPRFGMLHR